MAATWKWVEVATAMFSVNVNQPSWSQVEDYDAEDDAEIEGRAVFLRWPLDLKSKLRAWYEVDQESWCGALMHELREQTRLEEIMAQMEIVQLMMTILSFTMFAYYMVFLSVEMILTSSWRKRLLTSTTSGNGSDIPHNCRWRGWRRQCKFFWPV